jgi:hypothetical protein
MRSNPFQLSVTTAARRLSLGHPRLPHQTDRPDVTIASHRTRNARYQWTVAWFVVVSRRGKTWSLHTSSHNLASEFLLSSQLGGFARRVPKYLTLCERLIAQCRHSETIAKCELRCTCQGEFLSHTAYAVAQIFLGSSLETLRPSTDEAPYPAQNAGCKSMARLVLSEQSSNGGKKDADCTD